MPEVARAAKTALAQIREAAKPERRRPHRNAIQAMTFEQAVRRGLVEVEGAWGAGLKTVALQLRSRSKRPLAFVVREGVWFRPTDSSIQNMIARQPTEIRIPAAGTDPWRASNTYHIPVACANMGRTAPTARDSLTVEFGTASGDLALLLATPVFAEADFLAQQYAIWTVTDNPGRWQYAPIRDGWSAPIVPGQSRDPAVFDRVRELLETARIVPAKYRAFSQTPVCPTGATYPW